MTALKETTTPCVSRTTTAGFARYLQVHFPSPVGGSGSGDFLEMLHMKQLDSRANFGEEKHTHFHNISCIERNRFCFNEP